MISTPIAESGGAERAHAERHDVHRAAAHASRGRAPCSPGEDLPHLGGGLPVVGRAGVLLLLGADEGAVLDARDVGRVGGGVVGVRALDRVELLEGALGDELLAQALVLGLGSVAPDDAVRLGEFGDLVRPRRSAPGGWWGRWWEPRCRAPRLLLDEGFVCWMPRGGCDPDASSEPWRSSGADRTHLIIRRDPRICPEGLTPRSEHRHSAMLRVTGVQLSNLTRRP